MSSQNKGQRSDESKLLSTNWKIAYVSKLRQEKGSSIDAYNASESTLIVSQRRLSENATAVSTNYGLGKAVKLITKK